LSGCANLTVNFTNTSTNSNSWSWAFGDGNTSNAQNPSNTYNTPGQYTVTLIASDGSQSDTSIMVNYVTVYANAVAAFTPTTDTLCIGQSVTFNNTSTNSNNSSWTFGDGNTSTATSPSHTYGAVGNYTVTLIAQNANGCHDTITQNVFVTGANITPGTPLLLTCTNTSGTISATSTTPNVTYNWTGPGTITNGTSNTPTVNAPGTYTVVVTDPLTGCTNSDSVIVTQNISLPNVSGTGLTLTSCINSSGTITASSTTANVSYNWSGPGIVSGGNTNTPTVNATGTYTVTVTDPTNGCTNTATVVVNTNTPLPNVSASPLTIPCNQANGTVTASSTTPNVTYSWSGTGIVSGGTTPTATVNPGTYTVTVTDPTTGCSNTTTVVVTAAPGPTAIANTSTTIQQGQSVTLTASGGVNYNWFPTTNLTPTTGTTVIATPAITTVYCVEVADANGCKDTACVTITVEIPCPTNENLDLVPNAFSPNEDNVNDEFCLQGWSVCLEEFQVLIFDRWGEKVFESKDPNFCWDGFYRGTIMDAQVFVYYIKARFTDNDKPIIKKGNISLIR
jgi:gliding motility-associated-like protein